MTLCQIDALLNPGLKEGRLDSALTKSQSSSRAFTIAGVHWGLMQAVLCQEPGMVCDAIIVYFPPACNPTAIHRYTTSCWKCQLGFGRQDHPVYSAGILCMTLRAALLLEHRLCGKRLSRLNGKRLFSIDSVTGHSFGKSITCQEVAAAENDIMSRVNKLAADIEAYASVSSRYNKGLTA